MDRRSFIKSMLALSVAAGSGFGLNSVITSVSASVIDLSRFIIDKDGIRIYGETGKLRIAIGKLR